jgi:hypothetical protein
VGAESISSLRLRMARASGSELGVGFRSQRREAEMSSEDE